MIEEELATCPAAPADDAYADYKNLTAHDQRLHELILKIAGNDAVLQAFAKTHCHLHLFRLNFQQPFGVQTITEHRAIVDALVVGDGVGGGRFCIDESGPGIAASRRLRLGLDFGALAR